MGQLLIQRRCSRAEEEGVRLTDEITRPADIGESDSAIPLPNVSAPVLKKVSIRIGGNHGIDPPVWSLTLTAVVFRPKVLEYCTHHRNDPVPSNDEQEESRKRVTDISEWDQKFINVDQEMLFEIILAANYLDIKPLLDVGCKTVYVSRPPFHRISARRLWGEG